MGYGSPKVLAKAHKNVRSRKEYDGPRMPQGIKWAEDAQKNEIG